MKWQYSVYSPFLNNIKVNITQHNIQHFPLEIRMTVNINRAQGQKAVQNNFLSSSNFLKQNKVTVNQVVQTHFSVQGVQSYNQQELKVLKQRQQRLFNNKQGQFVHPKAYEISEELPDIDLELQLQQKKKINSSKLISSSERNKKKMEKQKQSVKPKLTNKQKLQTNNQIISRLQKKRNKQSVLQKKLEKLSKHYKQFFKGSNQQNKQAAQQQKHQQNQLQNNSSLCQSIQSITSSKKNKQNDDDFDQFEEEQDQGMQNIPMPKTAFNKDKLTNKTKSTKITKPKLSHLEGQLQSQDGAFQQVEWDLEDQEDENIAKHSLNKSSYSQKLGSAVHSLFH